MTGRRAGLAAGVGVGAAAAAALRRRWRSRDRSAPPPLDATGETFLDHLAAAIRIPTVSHQEPGRIDLEPFDRFHRFLRSTYPHMFERLAPEVVADHSLLFRWAGTDPDVPPVLFHGHMDVVPVEGGTEEDWPFPPFAAERDDRFLYGRGALDDKGHLIALLEAVEGLLVEGFQPDTTLYVSISHDEELGGARGAAALAALLEQRGVRFEFMLDEGGAVVEDFLPGARGPVAMLGVAEKGYADVEISIEGDGGHASVPPPQTVIGRLASAIAALEAEPMPARLEAQEALFTAMAPLVPGGMGVALRHARRLGPLLERRLAAAPATNALIRTTATVTMIEGGIKPNLLPQRARAIVNVRILPGDTIDAVLDHVGRVVGDGFEVRVLDSGFTSDPAPISDVSSASYALVADTIAEVFPDAVVAPWTLMGATDSRHFQPIVDQVFRFAPLRVVPADMGRIHGTAERIRLTDAATGVAFFARLIRRACGV